MVADCIENGASDRKDVSSNPKTSVGKRQVETEVSGNETYSISRLDKIN